VQNLNRKISIQNFSVYTLWAADFETPAAAAIFSCFVRGQHWHRKTKKKQAGVLKSAAQTVCLFACSSESWESFESKYKIVEPPKKTQRVFRLGLV
jgi:hypothetical protein